MMNDDSRVQAVLEIMQRHGVFAPQNEEQMHQLLLEVMHFACERKDCEVPGLVGDEWDEFEDEDS